MIQVYIKDELKKEYTTRVKNGKQSDTIRGMIMLYLSRPDFRTEVDKFVEVTKTI